MAIANGSRDMHSAGTIIMNNVAAVILVGGKSTRMGQDKATLPYQGKRLVDVVAGVVRSADVSTIYVSGEVEGYPAIPDHVPACGPVGGIASCLMQLEKMYGRLLFIPVDMPCLTPELIQLLVSQPADRACHVEGHPLPCMVPVQPQTMRCTDEVFQSLSNGHAISVKSFLDRLGARVMHAPDATVARHAFTNTNTPEEWREATHASAHQ